MKKLRSSLLAILFCVSGGISRAEDPVLIPAPPSLAGSSYVLMDADSGRVLVAKNERERLPPASLTKMMTSYVLSAEIINGNVERDDMVPISRNAWAQNPVFQGSSLMFIEVGKRVRLDDLHKGIIISSGNDASVAVAEYLAGSEDAFADIMNQRAELLGLTDTHFVNSHGLPAPNQYTSALDMARLARAVIADYPEDYRLYAERSFTFNGIAQSNRNKLLWRDPTVDGLKTGHTKAAGYCLVASAKRDEMRLIAVVMGTRSAEARAQENQKLLQYGFRFFETLKLYSAGEAVNEVRLWSGEKDSVTLSVAEDVYVTLPRGKRQSLKAEAEFEQVIKAPVGAGATLGRLHLSLDGEPLMQAQSASAESDGEPLTPRLVSLVAIEEAGFFARMWDAFLLFFYQLFGLSTV